MEHYKIGILGPKCFTLDGHDIHNPVRTSLRLKLSRILQEEKSKHHDLVGLTGLNIGTEQDFAIACKELSIPYISIIAFDKMESMWEDIEINKQIFKELKESSEYIISLNDPGYSPKKINHKNKQIIEMSNILIYVRTELFPVNKLLLDSIKIPVVFVDV